MRKGKRRITVPMIITHLNLMQAQYTAIVKHNAGGAIWQAEAKGGLDIIEGLLSDVKNDIPTMLKTEEKKY